MTTTTIRATRRDAVSQGYMNLVGTWWHRADRRTGMRYVPEEEDQVRRQDALVYALPELQDRMHLYAGGEEATASQRVGRGTRHGQGQS